MIDSKEKLKHCLQIEKKIYFPDGGIRLPFGIREKDVLYGYVYNLRKTAYHFNTNHKLRFAFYKMRLNRMSNLYALRIGLNACDEGLNLAHVGPIMINGKCKIGKNLRVNVGANIGSDDGEAPIIGDGVYVGPGAKLFGKIEIASGCRIGANAVVCKSFKEENCTLVGVPAKVVKSHNGK